MTKRKLTKTVYEIVKSSILTFRYLPGLKISDDEIAREIGISRTPVREALNRLAEQGLLESRPNRGFWVKTFSEKEVIDLYTLRASLECLAVELVSKKMNAKIGKSLKIMF